MRASLATATPLCVFAALALAGCTRMAQSWHLNGFDSDIASATREIAAARDDAQRSAAYTRRGHTYSEKASYCQVMKLISRDEFVRRCGIALQDHDLAVKLDPGSAEAYFSRGQTLYTCAVWGGEADARPWYGTAAADFEKAFALDGRRYMALDMLGMVHQAAGDLDQAIAAYTRELALDRLGGMRLAEAYCIRGGVRYRDKKYDAAAEDYEKAIGFDTSGDSCSCDSFNPLVTLYGGVGRQYGKAWDVVHRARKAGRWLAPEALEKLKKDSGRGE